MYEEIAHTEVLSIGGRPACLTVKISPEDFEPDYDDDANRAILASREDRLWGWCFVEVNVSVDLEGAFVEGAYYLGGCSYLDFDDFKAGGYYDDMVAGAISEACANFEKVAKAVAEMEANAAEYWACIDDWTLESAADGVA